MRTFAVILLFIGLAGAVYWLSLPQEEERAAVVIGRRTFSVEIADSPPERAIGLSGRDEIGSEGMLFVFDEPTRQCFWMQDTRFPLDIIFIRDGRVLSFEEMKANSLDNHCPQADITYALELPAFSASRYGISAGDPVQIILPED